VAGKIIADTIESAGSQISLNVGNVTILTASSSGLTLTPTSNVNINVSSSTLAFGAGSVSLPSITTSGDTNTGLYFPAADTIGFTEGGVEAMRINSSGNLQTLGTISVGAATPSTSGAGITFPATQSASSDANTLDDYEEGTWTPSVTSMTTTGTPAYAGMYTKIGRVVTVTFYTTTASGAVATYATIAGTTNVSGLPFSANAVIPNAAAGFAGIAINGNTNTGGFVQGPNSGTTFYFNSAITASQGLSVSITYYAST
jgi:hypothetical protein